MNVFDESKISAQYPFGVWIKRSSTLSEPVNRMLWTRSALEKMLWNIYTVGLISCFLLWSKCITSMFEGSTPWGYWDLPVAISLLSTSAFNGTIIFSVSIYFFFFFWRVNCVVFFHEFQCFYFTDKLIEWSTDTFKELKCTPLCRLVMEAILYERECFDVK